MYRNKSNVGQRRKRPDEEKGILVYSDTNINRVNKLVSTTIASILPIVAIIVLYTVKTTWQRIYVMIGFTAGFALALASVTSARKLEIFASTAA